MYLWSNDGTDDGYEDYDEMRKEREMKWYLYFKNTAVREQGWELYVVMSREA